MDNIKSFGLVFILVLSVISSSAEPPSFNRNRQQFRTRNQFARQEVLDNGANDAPYPAAGYQPSSAFTLPNERTIKDESAKEAPLPSFFLPLQAYVAPSPGSINQAAARQQNQFSSPDQYQIQQQREFQPNQYQEQQRLYLEQQRQYQELQSRYQEQQRLQQAQAQRLKQQQFQFQQQQQNEYKPPTRKYGAPATSESNVPEVEETSGEESTEQTNLESFQAEAGNRARLTDASSPSGNSAEESDDTKQKGVYYVEYPGGIVQRVEFSASPVKPQVFAKIQLQPAQISAPESPQLIQAQPIYLGSVVQPSPAYTAQYQAW